MQIRFATMLRAGVTASTLTGMPVMALGQTPAAPTKGDAPAVHAASSNPDIPDVVSAETNPPQRSIVTEQDIVVTGFRQSLRSAAQIKRNSDSILDAVVAEDIGKLPNTTAAETLARMPGVQAVRNGDEVQSILIRGLPNITTTYNGRDIFTTSGRGVNLTDFPAGALAGVEIYKSATASLIEPGLAGLVNVRSSKPFDFKGFEVAGGFRGTYNDQSNAKDPNFNLLVTNRWNTNAGEMGLLAQIAWPQFSYRVSTRYNGGNIVKPGTAQPVNSNVGRDFYFPDFVGVYYNTGYRYRPGANIAYQWRPSNNLEIYLDGLYQSFHGRDTNDSWGISLTNSNPALSDIVLDPSNARRALSMTVTNPFRPDIFRSTYKGDLQAFQFGGGLIWTPGRARISTDFAYSASYYTDTNWSFDAATIGSANGRQSPTLGVEFDREGGLSLDLPNFDETDPNNYVVRGFYERRSRTNSDGWQWRADLDLETDLSIMRHLQIGARYSTRTVDVDAGDRYAYLWDLQNGYSTLPTGTNIELVKSGFRGDIMPFRVWPVPSRESIRDNIDAYRQYSVDQLRRLDALRPGSQTGSIAAFSTPTVNYAPRQGFDASEQSYAFYAQSKYEFEIGQILIDGLFGARIVNTVGSYTGASLINGVLTTQTNSQNYVDVLPNASLRVRLTPEIQLRLAATKTRTRPGFDQLNPALNIATASAGGGNAGGLGTDAAGRIIQASGSGGNPDLQPLTSKNYDVTAEWYFSKAGSASIALFYRDLFGFIGNYERFIEDPVYGYTRINRPENAGAGRIKGVEASFQTAFDFLPGALKGLGVAVNGTYLDAQNQQPATFGADLPLARIPGVSKWAGNATLFYERGKLSTRIAYNYRSSWIGFYQTRSNNELVVGEAVRPVSRLDYSLNYTPIKEITLTFDISNILAQPYRFYRTFDGVSFPRDVRDEGRFYGIGARFRF